MAAVARRRWLLPLLPLLPLLALLPAADARALRRQRGHGGHGGLTLAPGGSAPSGAEAVYRVPQLLDRLREAAAESAHDVAQRYKLERERLTAALSMVPENSSDRALVQKALNASAEDYTEAQVAATEAMEFYYTAKGILGSKGAAPGCSFLACGPHGKCVEAVVNKKKAAHCECEACYEGDGYSCRAVPCTPATVGSALPVRGAMPPGYPTVPRERPGRSGELQLVAFGQDQIALVVREISNGNRGSLIIGKIVDTEVSWGTKQLLDPALATFGLALAASPAGRLAIGFRDREKGGVGYLMGGHVNASGGSLQALLSAPEAIARSQDEQMAFVQLQSSRVVCLYSEAEELQGQARAFGGALLAEVLAGGPVRILGKYRFAEGQLVSRLAAAALTPSSLVVAYRALLPPGAPAGQPSRELAALWMGVSEGELVMDPHPIFLEPDASGMSVRGLALVGKDTFAYTYSGKQQVVKTAIIHVDPDSHKMSYLESPKVVSRGLPVFMRSVSLPGSPYTPSTFTIVQRPKERCSAEVCRVSPHGRVADCRQVPWAEQPLRDASAARLIDGRIAVAFINPSEEVMYQLLSAEEHGAMLDFGGP